MRRLGLLCLLVVVVGGAPTDVRIRDPVEDPKEIGARKQRYLIPCLSSVKGYGLCDESLFVVEQSTGYPQSHTYNEQLPPYDQLPTDHFSPGQYSTYPHKIVTDQFVVIVSPNEDLVTSQVPLHPQPQNPIETTDAKELFVRLFKILEDIKTSNSEQFYEEPKFDLNQLNQVFEKIDAVTKNVTKIIIGTAYLQHKVNVPVGKRDLAVDVPDFDKIEKIFVGIEEAAKNISKIIAALNHRDKVAYTKDNNNTSETQGKSSGDATLDDLWTVSDEVDKILHTVKHVDAKIKDSLKRLTNHKNGDLSQPKEEKTSPIEPKQETSSPSESRVGKTSLTKPKEETSSPKEPREESTSLTELKEEETSPIDPERDIRSYARAIVKKLNEVPTHFQKSTTPYQFGSNLQKDFSEVNNRALINRLIEDVYDIAHEGVVGLRKITPKEMTDSDRESVIDSIVKGKYSNDEKKSREVALDGQIANFGQKIRELLEKSVTLEDLSKTVDALGEDKSPEANLTVTYEKVTKEDIDTLNDTITDLLASGVTLDKMDALAAKAASLEDFEKEKNGVIQDFVKNITLEDIVGEKRLREQLSDFSKTVSYLYKKGITQEEIDDLDDQVSDYKDYNKADILSLVESIPVSSKKKRDIIGSDETNLYAELYDIVAEILNTDYENDSIDAYIKKVDELISSGVSIETVFQTTINVTNDVVEKGLKPKREIKPNVIEIPKNDLYDVVKDAYNNNFTDSSLNAYFDKIDVMVRSGVEPFKILGNTLGNIVLMIFQDQEIEDVGRKVNNNELYEIIEEAIKNNMSDASMDAFGKKIDELQSRGADPIQLAIDVIGDLFIVLLGELRPKREVDDIAAQIRGISYEFLLTEFSDLYAKLDKIDQMLFKLDGLTEAEREQHLRFVSQLNGILRRWLQYCFEQVEAIDLASKIKNPVVFPLIP